MAVQQVVCLGAHGVVKCRELAGRGQRVRLRGELLAVERGKLFEQLGRTGEPIRRVPGQATLEDRPQRLRA
jgi:hypothetical protein